MHLAFTTYGIKNHADFLIEDFIHKYLPLRLHKKGEKDVNVLMQVQVRVLPFGIYELVFPKEFLNEILSALNIDLNSKHMKRLNKSYMGIKPIKMLRKFLELEPIPKYKKVAHPNFPMPEYKKFVGIIPLGIRRDGEITEKSGPYKGWKHEAI